MKIKKRYLKTGPYLVDSGPEPGLYELVYRYYRAQVNPMKAHELTIEYLSEVIKGKK